MNGDQEALEIPTGYEGWAVLELMGHRKRPGRLSPDMQYGKACVRVDIPYRGATVTEYYFPVAIYGFRPCTKEYAEAEAEYCTDLQPVQSQRLLPLDRPTEAELADESDFADGDPDRYDID